MSVNWFGKHLFTPSELDQLRRAAVRAEELVGDYFQLGSMERDVGHYDVMTSADHGMVAAAPGALAEVVLLQRLEAPPSWSGRLGSFFRILVFDDSLIASAERLRAEEVSLDDVMLHVMTHELVHVVRFARFLGRFSAAPLDMEAEEERVSRETAAVLARLNSPALQRLSAPGSAHPGGGDCAAPRLEPRAVGEQWSKEAAGEQGVQDRLCLELDKPVPNN